MRFLYPSDPTNPKVVDDTYSAEYDAAIAADIQTSLFSFEDFEVGSFRARPAINAGDVVLYRGWMLPVPRYKKLSQVIEAMESAMLTSAEQYRLCHHLPAWYPLLQEFTAETVVLPRDADFPRELKDTAWPGYFVKDFVKSLSTAGGSLVAAPGDIERVVALIEKYRGVVEGGVCVRRREDFKADSEQRFFVVGGQPHAANGTVPAVVTECSKRISSPFYSVDTAVRIDGVIRIIELGDGQVSDRKEWQPAQFVKVISANKALHPTLHASGAAGG